VERIAETIEIEANFEANKNKPVLNIVGLLLVRIDRNSLLDGMK
jgi:hypothetical protein